VTPGGHNPVDDLFRGWRSLEHDEPFAKDRNRRRAARERPGLIRKVYGFTLKPDRIFCCAQALTICCAGSARRYFDYWESGMDLHLRDDMY
jgi:hypothetical protein